MKTAAVICEYNPFHYGHRHQLEQTRALGATHIAAVMSGDFTQRGDLAVTDKFARAKTALENGADYFLNKTITSKQLVESIKKRYNNHSDFDDYLENRLLSSGISLSNENKSLLFLLNVLKNLTKSEIEVLSDLCKGLSYSEISQKRFVTENTVRSQIVRMVSKIKCKNIKELVSTAKSLDIFKFYNL